MKFMPGRLFVMGMAGLTLVSVVMAADATPGARKKEMRQEVRQIRDAKKKMIVERVDAKIAEINKRRVDTMLAHLNKMSEILAKVKTWGGNTVAAEAAVADARAAVVDQAAKTYTIQITTEDKLKIQVGEALKTLKTDLQAVHQKVVDARKATANAIRSVRPILTP